MEYHKTKNTLQAMRLLGHNNIKNTLVYTQLVTFEDDDYLCKAAVNVKEATELIEAGYENVCDVEHVKLFRTSDFTVHAETGDVCQEAGDGSWILG